MYVRARVCVSLVVPVLVSWCMRVCATGIFAEEAAAAWCNDGSYVCMCARVCVAGGAGTGGIIMPGR